MHASNALVAHYHAANEASGHRYDCAYGAGADCTCPAGEVTYYFVTVVLGGDVFIVFHTQDKAAAQEKARGYAKSRWQGVRCRRAKFHYMDDALDHFLETAERHSDRLEDWATDADPC